ncbi:MAG: hypothetical protein BWX60_00945 [Candidatus Marinimicrobia bacterium ADurb.Bin030]|nr:MAG: hypothetical protein BWX60_00945 [Candidatus Marinimicrobia bacterium ADurb.Bin030]
MEWASLLGNMTLAASGEIFVEDKKDIISSITSILCWVDS